MLTRITKMSKTNTTTEDQLRKDRDYYKFCYEQERKNYEYTKRRLRTLVRYVLDNYESEVRDTDGH